MTAETTKPERSPKKKRDPAYVRRVTISIPLDPENLATSMATAESAFKKIGDALPKGTQVKVAEGNPLGHMEAV